MGDLNLDAANAMANGLVPDAENKQREALKLGQIFAHVAIAFTRAIVTLTAIAEREAGDPR